MKKVIDNIGYFIRETYVIIKLNKLSNIFSFFSTGLILFVCALVVAGWLAGTNIITMLQNEGEVNAYFNAEIAEGEVLKLVDKIKGINGVYEAKIVGKDEAYTRMEEVLGEEAHVLELFDENPFEAFIEVRLNISQIDPVVKEIKDLKGIDFVRDNYSVLKRIENMVNGIKIVGTLIITAVSVTTLVLISHLIRQGIYNNRDQINTLRLLGASNRFIGVPFMLSGTIITLAGGLLAILLISIVINLLHQNLGGLLPFIPLPAKSKMMSIIISLIVSASVILGIMGSLFALHTVKDSKDEI
jgi:cell division transport system permease protein